MKFNGTFLFLSVPLRRNAANLMENLSSLCHRWHSDERGLLQDQVSPSAPVPINPPQRTMVWAVLLVLILFVGFAHGQQQAVATSTGAKYAGPEACKTCHEDIFKGFEKSPHWNTLLDKRGGSAKQGCEACHGPGWDHIEGGGDKTKIFSFRTAPAKQVNERCLECHASGKDHANFARSAHSESNLSCLSCHSSHHPGNEHFLLVKAQPELCNSCHLKMKAQFNMPFHHRVEEGLVHCADCHNPHGGFLKRQLRSAAARDSVCYTCHVDKQGPFVFEHPGGKVEGCESCHSPHGSPNPHLLKTSNLNILCLKCHTGSTFASASGTPDFHNQAGPYQACTICHVAIHGSNFDRHLLK